MDHIIELRKRVALLEKQLENALSYIRPLFEQQRRYLEALRSIASNTCCDRCQEAALVARAALKEKK
jgi:hypothetical protein